MSPEVAAHPPLHDQRDLRALADELLEDQRVEFIEDGVLNVMPPAGFTHAKILLALTFALNRASILNPEIPSWDVRSENFQFDLVDDTQKFFVPDLAVAFPGSNNNKEFRENLALVVEVTSPGSPQTVRNDRTIKPKQYARAGIPCYLLVDQEAGRWELYVLQGDWPGYQVHSQGKYGGRKSDPVKLPEPFGFAIPTDEWPAFQED